MKKNLLLAAGTGHTIEEFGIILRSGERARGGYRLNFSPNKQTVSLGNTMIGAVSDLNKTLRLEIIVKDDIIDVCVDDKRCIVNRAPEQKGSFLWFYVKHGEAKFRSLKLYALKDPEQ